MREEDRLSYLARELNMLRRLWEVRLPPHLNYIVLGGIYLGNPFSPPRTDLLIFLPQFYPLLQTRNFCLPEQLTKRGEPIGEDSYQGWVLVRLDYDPDLEFSPQASIPPLIGFVRRALQWLEDF